MKKIFFEYIEEAKKLTICDSYRKIAQYLDAPPIKISQWKQGKGYVSPAECAHLARLLGITTEEIAYVIKAEREEIPEKKEYWYKEAEIFSRPINPPESLKLKNKKS
ncbi:hypothetical protein V3W87_004436 [Salmonella enterica]|nr:hypothetical protein [Salmonella enterica]QGX90799.1 hypothetical protein EFZ10_03590 [Tatumella sp. TA1]HAW7070741.1 hypothetical protein [Escherichia coli]EGG8986727.1 hypothetical protein [Salmonella enterica]EIB4649643.1 hypothetical protein [Salmonella enterica]